MSSIDELGISGFRGYSNESFQKIEFSNPLTLIWGKNGSGKTTIIECLKYITTGSLPPFSEKGKSFILDPKLANSATVTGQIMLKFKAYNGRQVIAKRKATITAQKKASKFESVEQSLQARDTNGQLLEINHNCAQIQKQVPEFLGISQSVLQNIVFCHQDQSLWPFSDNNTLKKIFDQLFETKRFTQVLDAYSELIKDFNLQLKELNCKIPLLKERFDDVNRKQYEMMDMYQQAIKDSDELAKLKQHADSLKCELRVNDDLLSRRNNLERSKGTEVEKLRNTDEQIRKIRKEAEALSQEEGKYSINLKNLPTQSAVHRSMELPKIELQQVTLRLKSLKETAEELRFSKINSQTQIYINAQIRRIKEFFPAFERLPNHEQVFIKELQDRCKAMSQKKRKLQEYQKELAKIVLPACLDQQITPEQYQQKSTKCLQDKKKVDELKQELLAGCHCFYKKIKAAGRKQFEPGLENQLHDLQIKLKIKQQELVYYKAAPRVVSTKEDIFKMKFMGIELPSIQVEYCEQNKKCNVCSKPLSPYEIEKIKHKCLKTKEKAEMHAAELESQLRRVPEVDPDAMVSKLTQEIAVLIKKEDALAGRYNEFQEYQAESEQIRINEVVESVMRKLQLTAETTQNKNKYQNIESFKAAAFTYQHLLYKLENSVRQLKTFDERSKRNKEAYQERQRLELQKKGLLEVIEHLQEETKHQQLAQDFLRKLDIFQKSKKSQSKVMKGFSESQSENRSCEEVENEMAAADALRIKWEKQIAFWQYNLKLIFFVEQSKAISGRLQTIEDQLKSIDLVLHQKAEKSQECNRITIEYEKKKHEYETKLRLLEQQPRRQNEEEYLTCLNKQQFLKKLIKDLEQICESIELGVNEYHTEKMEEVNEILFHIWKQIYHSQDIDHIEIKAWRDEDSTRRKNFNYAIVMAKKLTNKQSERMIDMKGRCSMGQKVLASVVIRLALAEAFSPNSRILALDEPTTNLDQEHIQNLAAQLSNLIELNGQGNFQLIIISHDFEFIRALESHTSSFYEIYRNKDNFSMIQKRDITEINDGR